MAHSFADGEFWLPAEFLTDDDLLMDKESLPKDGLNSTNYCFPTEFPYDFNSTESSSALGSPVDSFLGSIETESDGEDSLAGLTHRFARSSMLQTQQVSPNPQKVELTQKTTKWVLSGSPQSTLSPAGNWSDGSPVSSNGSPNAASQLSSPTATQLGPNNDAWDLIYAAAGQVARLKMNGGDGPPNGGPSRSFIPAVHPSPPVKHPCSGFYPNQFQKVRETQFEIQNCSSIWGRAAKEGSFYNRNQVQQQGSQKFRECSCGCARNGRFDLPPLVGVSQSPSFPRFQVQNRPQTQTSSGMRTGSLGGSGVKKQCSGTGVFLPRSYANPNPDVRKKPGHSTALLQARVVQALNKNYSEMTPSHAQPQPVYDALLARRNAILAQQGRINHEISRLPKEWTY